VTIDVNLGVLSKYLSWVGRVISLQITEEELPKGDYII